jgi:hypothetical protein
MLQIHKRIDGSRYQILKLQNGSTAILNTSVKFEYSTVVTIKNAVFWDVAPCSYFVNRRFGGTYRLHLQGIRNPRAMNQRELVDFLYSEDGGDTFIRNVS